MVDFRYHLVSLVSVFLSLALGIILGAGPLQNSIGNALQDQVTELRTSREQLRSDLDQMTQERDGVDAALEIAGGQLIPGTLEGRRIGLVLLPQVNASDVENARGRIEKAGGSIAAQIQLEEGFVLGDNASYRNALASQMAEHIEGVDEGSDPITVLATALSTIARGPSADPNIQSLAGYFTVNDEGHALATFNQSSEQGVDAVLIVVPTGLVDTASESETLSAEEKEKVQAQQEEQKAAHAIWQTFYTTFAKGGPTVALGQASEGSLLTDLRSTNAGSTVDSPGTAAGGYNTVFALASAITGNNVSLGSGPGASAPFGTRVDAGNHD